MPYLPVSGGQLHYRLDGIENGPPIVLSNSLGTNLDLWEPQLAALSESFRVVRYDTRGHGVSRVTPVPYTFNQLADDVVSLLDHLKIGRAHFCGISMGGLTGMVLGLRHADRIDKMIFANAGAKFGTSEGWTTRIETVKSKGMSSIVETVLKNWYTPEFAVREPNTIEWTREMLVNTDPEGYVAACGALRDADSREEIAQIGNEVLVIAGAKDPSVPIENARFVAEQIPGAGFLELPAAHLSNVEAAQQFSDAVLKFLDPENKR